MELQAFLFKNKINITMALAFFLFSFFFINHSTSDMAINSLMVEVLSPRFDDTYHVFYDTGAFFNKDETSKCRVSKGLGYTKVYLTIPGKDVRRVRVDMGHHEGPILVRSMALCFESSFHHHVLYQWSSKEIARDFGPKKDISSLGVENGLLQIISSGKDPGIENKVDLVSLYNKVNETIPAERDKARRHLHGISVLITLLILFIKPLSAILTRMLILLFGARAAGFTPDYRFRCCFIFVLALVVVMAIVSKDLERSPDEHWHAMGAKYYFDHWLPPKVGDPEARDTYSYYGYSYINYYWIEYLLAGKLSSLFMPLVNQEFVAIRLFNVFLLLILVAILFHRSRNGNDGMVVFLLLLVSPQVWYVFGYFNNDAFPMFLAFLVLSELTFSKSRFNRFLHSERLFKAPLGGILLGLLLGLLSISKQNYHVFILFVFIYFMYELVTRGEESSGGADRPARISLDVGLVKKYALVLLVVLGVYSAKHGIDVGINGFDRKEKLLDYQEQVAESGFKPSNIQEDMDESFYGLKLKEKGVKYSELFTEWDWHTKTFKSFMGVYGRMAIYASTFYYVLMGLLYVTFMVFAVINLMTSRSRSVKWLLMIVVAIIPCMVVISTYYSWIRDFQAQGRYLFPVLGILSLLIYKGRQHLNNMMVNAFISILFLMSVYSFLFIGLYQINL